MQNDTIWFGDTLIHVRAAHEAGRDGLSCLESTAPHGDSPPLHVHRTEDELFHVVAGRLRLRAGDEDIELAAGETFLAPQGLPHTYRVESDEARWLVVTTNGDFEGFVRAAGRPAEQATLPAPSGPPTPEQQQAFAELALRHGIELVGPPLA
jgi:quercetin dioxygenase-like cupin family protein